MQSISKLLAVCLAVGQTQLANAAPLEERYLFDREDNLVNFFQVCKPPRAYTLGSSLLTLARLTSSTSAPKPSTYGQSTTSSSV
ncbi:hypothetical protein LTR17_003476 [Elasticomyces elasticus]|nr:hypothetical protein LTR17_003476 [Elasticomyces elasticus]